jgi:hypothetical protein
VAIQAENPDPDKLRESSRASVERLQSLVDELKTIEEHEKNIVANDEPPLFRSGKG